MSDAIGGVVNMVLVMFFLVFIALYMSFSINYQKAFNVKNKIISIYEESGGICDAECTSKIKAYEDELGYGKVQMINMPGYKCLSKYEYCVKGIQTGQTMTTTKAKDSKILKQTASKSCYFRIVTQVEIAIPLINNLMELSFFQVTGQTKSIDIVSTQTCDTIAKQVK